MIEKAMTFPAFRPGPKKLLSRSVEIEFVSLEGHKSTVSKVYLLTGLRKALRA